MNPVENCLEQISKTLREDPKLSCNLDFVEANQSVSIMFKANNQMIEATAVHCTQIFSKNPCCKLTMYYENIITYGVKRYVTNIIHKMNQLLPEAIEAQKKYMVDTYFPADFKA